MAKQKPVKNGNRGAPSLDTMGNSVRPEATGLGAVKPYLHNRGDFADVKASVLSG